MGGIGGVIVENVVVIYYYLQLLTCGGIRELKSWREDFEEIVKGASYIHEVDTRDTSILVLVIRLIVYYYYYYTPLTTNIHWKTPHYLKPTLFTQTLLPQLQV